MLFCSLVEMFTGNLFERLLSASRPGNGLDNRDEVVDHDSNDADELLISVIGPLLWSKSHFELPRPSFDDDGESGSDDDNQVNSNLSRKTEETESHNDEVDSNKRKRRKVATTRMSASQVCYELSKANVSPHLLIAPHVYGESFGAGSSASQPFRITVHPQVGFLPDFHGHLCGAEVIGLLAGKWDGEMKVLYVQAAFPCMSTERREDDGSTDVELDPVAELAVREIISNLGLVVVGWYHSHPLFRPDPSVTDINNQHQYQTLMRDEKSGLEPFIGLIVSTFDTQLPSVESHHQWFHTRPYSDGTRGKKPVPIPMLLETTIGTYIDENQNVSLFLDSDQSEALVQKVINLTDDSTTSSTVKNTNGMISTVKGIEKEENSANINHSEGQTKHFTSHHNESHDDNGDKSGSDGNGCVEGSGNSIKTMISFRGAGGSEYLGMTDNINDSEGVSEKLGAASGKRKYVKKSVAAPDINATERRSGRETKAPTLFVPEKEKKIALHPPSLPVNPSINEIPPEIFTVAKIKSQKIFKNIKVLPNKIVAPHFQEEVIVRIPGKKKNVSDQIGSMDKWLKAGGEIITPGPILNAKRGIRLLKKESEPFHKEVIKVNQRGKGVQEVKIDADILESKKRHGPGARGSKSMLKIPNRGPLGKAEVPSSSSSSSSSVAGKRQKVALTSKWLDDLERTEASSSSSSSSSSMTNKRKNVPLTSKWLDDLERTEPSSSSSSSSALPGKRKKIPNTSKWLDDFEDNEPSPTHKIMKGKKGIKSKNSPKKTLKQKFDLTNIESIINGNSKKQSATSKAVVNSVGTAGEKRKKGVILVKEDLFCDEIIMQKIKPPAPVKKGKKNRIKIEHEHEHKNENENVNEDENDLSNDTEDDGITLLNLLQGTSESAVRGRKLICSVNPTHRCLIVGIVGLGFYYSTHPRRMNLNAVWRDEILKFDKVKGSITYWASKLNIPLSCQVRLIADISEFLVASWLEGDNKIPIIPEKKEKKKKSNIDTIVPGSSHVTKGGTVIIYKEDDGKDDEPKKKKKKKISKK